MKHTSYIIDVDAATLTPNLGELCPGQDVVLTCSTTDGFVMNWLYNEMNLDTAGFLSSDPISTTRDLMVSGFMFSLELTSSMPDTKTHLTNMNYWLKLLKKCKIQYILGMRACEKVCTTH